MLQLVRCVDDFFITKEIKKSLNNENGPWARHPISNKMMLVDEVVDSGSDLSVLQKKQKLSKEGNFIYL